MKNLLFILLSLSLHTATFCGHTLSRPELNQDLISYLRAVTDPLITRSDFADEVAFLAKRKTDKHFGHPDTFIHACLNKKTGAITVDEIENYGHANERYKPAAALKSRAQDVYYALNFLHQEWEKREAQEDEQFWRELEKRWEQNKEKEEEKD